VPAALAPSGEEVVPPVVSITVVSLVASPDTSPKNIGFVPRATSSGARTLALALAVIDAADKLAEYKPAVNAAAPAAIINLFLRIMICFSKK
jgi:hypothetical protein